MARLDQEEAGRGRSEARPFDQATQTKNRGTDGDQRRDQRHDIGRGRKSNTLEDARSASLTERGHIGGSRAGDDVPWFCAGALWDIAEPCDKMTNILLGNFPC